jgi:hypothetical protein
MDESSTKGLAESLRTAGIKRQEKLDAINRRFPTISGISFFLLMKLSKEKIEEIGTTFSKKKDYRANDLTDELLTVCGYINNPISFLLSEEPKQFSLSDMRSFEYYTNNQGRRESDYWIGKYDEIESRLKNISNQMEKKILKKSKVIDELQKTIKILEKFKKFDKTKYDRNVFEGARKRYDNALKYEKHYEKCLLTELKERGIVGKGFEETEEFLNWCDAFKKYRANPKKVKSSSPKK